MTSTTKKLSRATQRNLPSCEQKEAYAIMRSFIGLVSLGLCDKGGVKKIFQFATKQFEVYRLYCPYFGIRLSRGFFSLINNTCSSYNSAFKGEKEIMVKEKSFLVKYLYAQYIISRCFLRYVPTATRIFGHLKTPFLRTLCR